MCLQQRDLSYPSQFPGAAYRAVTFPCVFQARFEYLHFLHFFFSFNAMKGKIFRSGAVAVSRCSYCCVMVNGTVRGSFFKGSGLWGAVRCSWGILEPLGLVHWEAYLCAALLNAPLGEAPLHKRCFSFQSSSSRDTGNRSKPDSCSWISLRVLVAGRAQLFITPHNLMSAAGSAGPASACARAPRLEM